jgi:TolB protein
MQEPQAAQAETDPTGRPGPGPGRWRRTALVGLSALVLVTASFAAGRASAPDPDTEASRLHALGVDESATDPAHHGATDTTTAGAAADLTDPTDTSEAPPETPPAPPPMATATVAVPAAAAPASPQAATSPTTNATAALPPATLDPGEPVCVAPDAKGPVRGDVVGVIADDGIHEVSLDGTRDVLLPGTAPGQGGAPMLQPAWSADGRRLAFVRNSATRQNRLRYPSQDLYVVDLDKGCTRLLTRSGSDSFQDPSWAPDGSRLSYTRAVDGAPSRESSIVETARDDGTDVVRVATAAMGGRFAPDGSGRIAYGRDGGLSVADRAGKVTVVDDTTGGAEYASWSPDATRLVYTVSVHQGIWVAAADGSGVRNLAPSSGSPNGIFWSRWSFDGRRIVFAQQDALWVVDADGANARKVGTTTSFNGGFWSPDGTAVVAHGDGGIVVTPVDGGTSRVLRSSGNVAATFRRP